MLLGQNDMNRFFATMTVLLAGCGTAVYSPKPPHAWSCPPDIPYAWSDGYCRGEREHLPVPGFVPDPGFDPVPDPGFNPVPDPCRSDRECDDGLFCNGVEKCDGGECVASSPPCAELCDEALRECYYPEDGCRSDRECDDGLFCNGAERCERGECVASSTPCAELCDEALRECYYGCPPNSLVAVNDILFCCPVGYPWYGADGYCHEAYLLADDGTFLGDIDGDPFNADGIANRLSVFGDPLSAISIWNESGAYGSDSGPMSPWSTTTTPPSVFLDDPRFATPGPGNFAGYLTAAFMVPSIHPNDLAVAIGRGDLVRWPGM